MVEKVDKNANIDCVILVDMIFEKIIGLMAIDQNMSETKKFAVVKGAKWIKDPVKEYLIKMPNYKAADIMNEVRKIACKKV